MFLFLLYVLLVCCCEFGCGQTKYGSVVEGLLVSCLFTSVHLTAAPVKSSCLQSSWTSLCSGKDSHIYRRCYYVPVRREAILATGICLISSTVSWGRDYHPSLEKENETQRHWISHSRLHSEKVRESHFKPKTKVDSKVSFLSTVLCSNEKIHPIKKRKSGVPFDSPWQSHIFKTWGLLTQMNF